MAIFYFTDLSDDARRYELLWREMTWQVTWATTKPSCCSPGTNSDSLLDPLGLFSSSNDGLEIPNILTEI